MVPMTYFTSNTIQHIAQQRRNDYVAAAATHRLVRHAGAIRRHHRRHFNKT